MAFKEIAISVAGGAILALGAAALKILKDIDVIKEQHKNFALKSDIPRTPDLSRYALKEEIPEVPNPPDLSSYALKNDLEPLALRKEVVPLAELVNYASQDDLSRVNELVDNRTDLLKIPRNAIVAFDLEKCPSPGWEEYKPLYGRFIRGVDNSGAKIDPDGKRPPGGPQEDLLKSHNHIFTTYRFPPSIGGGQISIDDSLPHQNFPTSNTGGAETRPKNIALLYCIKR